jgi:hypothetical protein
MPVYESNIAEACFPEPEDHFGGEWTDDDDEEYDYWEFLYSLVLRLSTDSLADRLRALELMRRAIHEWLDAVYADDDLDVDYPPAFAEDAGSGAATAPGSNADGPTE